MKFKIFIYSLIISLIFSVHSYAFWFFGSSKVKNGEVVIVHTNDAHARIRGCGCRHAGGGLIKRSYKVKELRKELKEFLLLDAGNFLFGDPQSDKVQGEFIVAAYNLMGYDACNISPHEFKYGIQKLKELQKKANFDFISANIYDKKTDKLLFEPYKIYKKNGVKIAVIGICDTLLYRIEPKAVSLIKESQITIKNPYKILPDLVNKLSKKADLIVLMSYSGFKKDIKIADNIKGIDVIVGGYSSHRIYEKRGNTYVGQAYRDGKYMGKIDCKIIDGEKKYTGKIISMERNDMDDQEMKDLLKKFNLKE